MFSCVNSALDFFGKTSALDYFWGGCSHYISVYPCPKCAFFFPNLICILFFVKTPIDANFDAFFEKNKIPVPNPRRPRPL